MGQVRVPKNVFLNSETSDLTTCSQLQQMSFKPWKECPSISEQESRRHRRDANLEDSLSRAEARIKQLEEDLRQTKNIDKASYVCITESGEIKQSGDSWTLSNINAELICFCQEGLIKCKLAA
ncbi:uncharacterized protein LOC111695645 [Eurytemora carolleeae]|uniref:uncharacterized protein LOC111695645 n=1 Tax=Eurytemora carolleeae TaxID=1294199 RepID=UPI000C782B98|nr:uncharacterized protein LOC111695645 [Eurytemora carolleeae]|eukprot:XP_023320803.1 uncharacterized protein LOC111695645 [Eurytemora affinis]